MQFSLKGVFKLLMIPDVQLKSLSHIQNLISIRACLKISSINIQSAKNRRIAFNCLLMHYML